jgi:hypothetical protein
MAALATANPLRARVSPSASRGKVRAWRASFWGAPILFLCWQFWIKNKMARSSFMDGDPLTSHHTYALPLSHP